MTGSTGFLRRTPLQQRLVDEQVPFAALDDVAVPDGHDADGARASLAIADLSALPRLGFKGRGTIPAMKARGILVEAEPNRAFRQPDGGLCLVLAPGEVVLLAGLSGDGTHLAGIEAGWRIEDEERTYPIPRRDGSAWFVVTGARAPEMFAKICAIDLRPHKFADLAIAQTSVARLTAIVVREDRAGGTFFHVLADSAAAAYFYDCLRDAAAEFDGKLIGITALRG